MCIIVNCTEKITNSSNDMLSIMKKGIKKRIDENKNKHIGSHNIFQIVRLHKIFYIAYIYFIIFNGTERLFFSFR